MAVVSGLMQEAVWDAVVCVGMYVTLDMHTQQVNWQF